LKEDILHRTL